MFSGAVPFQPVLFQSNSLKSECKEHYKNTVLLSTKFSVQLHNYLFLLYYMQSIYQSFSLFTTVQQN